MTQNNNQLITGTAVTLTLPKAAPGSILVYNGTGQLVYSSLETGKFERAAKCLKAKPNHYIVVLKDLFSHKRRDQKGNLIKPTIQTRLREQGFQIRAIYDDPRENYYYKCYKVVHIRTEEKFNYFRLIFADEIESYCKVSDL